MELPVSSYLFATTISVVLKCTLRLQFLYILCEMKLFPVGTASERSIVTDYFFSWGKISEPLLRLG